MTKFNTFLSTSFNSQLKKYLTGWPIQIWLLLVIALAFGLRLYRLDVQSLWFDEIITVALARVSWYQGLLGLLAQGIQLTPLFHGIVKLWLTVGNSDWMLRIPAVIVSVVTIPIIFKLGQFYCNKNVGLLAAFIFAINPYQVWFGQELRLYSLLPLTAAGSMLGFGQIILSDGQRGWRKLLVFNAIGFAAHYFMFLIPTVQFVYFLITFKQTYSLLRRWFLVQLLAVVPLIPWWGFIIKQQHFAIGVGWVPTPAWFEPFITFWNFTFAYSGQVSVLIVVGLSSMIVGLGLGVWEVKQKTAWGSLMILWLLLPPVIIVAYSMYRKSFYVDRYLLIISPVLTLLIVTGLLSIRGFWLRWGLVGVFVLATSWGLWQVYFDQTNFSKENWRTLARTLDAQANPQQAVITCTDGHRLSFEYYNPHQNLKDENVFFADQVDRISPSHPIAWIVDVHPRLSMHHLSKTLSPKLDTSLLSSSAANWEANNLQTNITVSGISAYQYNITNTDHLPDIVDWYCKN